MTRSRRSRKATPTSRSAGVRCSPYAIKNKTALTPRIFNSGMQVVTATSVDMGNCLPPVTFQALAARSGGDREVYELWIVCWPGTASWLP